MSLDAIDSPGLHVFAGKTPTVGNRTDAAEIEKAAKQFESVLVTRMIEAMRSTIEESGLLESPGGQQMQDLFWHQLGEQVGQSGSIGVWKQLARQIAAQPASQWEVSA